MPWARLHNHHHDQDAEPFHHREGPRAASFCHTPLPISPLPISSPWQPLSRSSFCHFENVVWNVSRPVFLTQPDAPEVRPHHVPPRSAPFCPWALVHSLMDHGLFSCSPTEWHLDPQFLAIEAATNTTHRFLCKQKFSSPRDKCPGMELLASKVSVVLTALFFFFVFFFPTAEVFQSGHFTLGTNA